VEAIRVGIRVCPPGPGMSPAEKQVVRCEGGRAVFAEAHELLVDAAMDSRDPSSTDYTSQADVYELFGRRVVDHAFEGYSSAIFAYGQTGTGKTTTIMGDKEPASERGLLPRILEDIFQRSEAEASGEVQVRLQMLEVYNEKIRDLIAGKAPAGASSPGSGARAGSKDARQQPEVRVHPKHGVYVTGAVEPSVASLEEALKLLACGDAAKSVAETAMNRKSSRAHTVIKLHVEINAADGGSSRKSDVFVVDLAGRENEKTSQVTGERMKELICINKSLFHLSNCIQSLGGDGAKVCQGRRKASASDLAKFRNSTLTLLLRNALTGNSRTAMIGTIHPGASHLEETMKTLRVAAAVKSIKLKATTRAVVDKDLLVEDLRREIQQLKEQLLRQRTAGEHSEDSSVDAEEKGAAGAFPALTDSAEASVHAQQEELAQKREELRLLEAEKEERLEEERRQREELQAEVQRAAEARARSAAELALQQLALEQQRAEMCALEEKWETAARMRAAEEERHREAQEAEQRAVAEQRLRLVAEAEAQQVELERKQQELQALSGLREERQAEAARAAAEAEEQQAALFKRKEELQALEAEWEKAAKQRTEEEQRRRDARHAEVARALRERKRLAKEAEAQQAELEAKQQELQALQRLREEQEAAAVAAAAECERLAAASREEQAELKRRREELQALEAEEESSPSSMGDSSEPEASPRTKKDLETELDRKIEELQRLEKDREEAEQRRVEEERIHEENRARLAAEAAVQRADLEQRVIKLRAAGDEEAARNAWHAEAIRRREAEAQEAEQRRCEAHRAEVRAAEQRGWLAAEASARHAEFQRRARQLERYSQAVLTTRQSYSNSGVCADALGNVPTPLRTREVRAGGGGYASPVITERRQVRRSASKEAMSAEVVRMASCPSVSTTTTTTYMTYVPAPVLSESQETPFSDVSQLPVHKLAQKFLVQNSETF